VRTVCCFTEAECFTLQFLGTDATDRMEKDPIDAMIGEIREDRKAVWRDQPPPATDRLAQILYVQDRFRALSAELIEYGVSGAILEGTYLVAWLKVACAMHLPKGGLEFCLSRIGPVMQSVTALLQRLYQEIEDDGPVPGMKALEEKITELRRYMGFPSVGLPTPERAQIEQDLAYSRIQPLLAELLDEQVDPGVLESLLLYFWFRMMVVRHNLKEEFFQKLERNWDTVMGQVNQYLETLSAQMR